MLRVMINWLEKIQCALSGEPSVILVTVIAVRGSAPREIGAKLLVSEKLQWGTVGGGNLEYKAIARARDMISACQSSRAAMETTGQAMSVHSFALGPALGQCCGGYVDLLFERIDLNTEWLQRAIKLTSDQSARHYWVCRSLAGSGNHQFVTDGQTVEQTGKDPFWSLPQVRQRMTGHRASALITDSSLPRTAEQPLTAEQHTTGQRTAEQHTTRQRTAGDKSSSIASDQICSGTWWCESLDPVLPEVWVFGAGHVGRALHEQLQLLPCNTVAVDSRDEQLQALSPSVRIVSTDSGASEVMAAPAGTWFFVMTHSHALDFDICLAVLQRHDFAYLGLIGSATKRATFAKRLAHRGIEQKQIDRLICPIGLTTIRSRVPQLIALGVATDLAQRWQISDSRPNPPTDPHK